MCEYVLAHIIICISHVCLLNSALEINAISYKNIFLHTFVQYLWHLLAIVYIRLCSTKRICQVDNIPMAASALGRSCWLNLSQ